MTGAIPAITVWEPWATLIAEGWKVFEFRPWVPPQHMIGTRIAIHAGARPVRVTEVRAMLTKLHSARWRESGIITEDARGRAMELLEELYNAPNTLPVSSVLCTVTLGAALAKQRLAAALGVEWREPAKGDRANFGWPLTDIERLEPFMPARGFQGFWNWQPNHVMKAQA